MLIAVLIASALTIGMMVFLMLRQAAAHQAAAERFTAIERTHERLERGLREDLARGREDTTLAARNVRDDVRVSLGDLSAALQLRVNEASQHQRERIEGFATTLKLVTSTLEQQLLQLTTVVDERLRTLQEDNGKRLEQMRATVDEKLQGTLERRLGESFKQVSDRLEQVHKGLGEMQTLAVGVGDLRKVLTNVKTRGNWGEVQLGNLLEQVLTADQYAVNVATVPGSRERVEFAIRMPGHDAQTWLPIDSKFPLEDYQRLVDASERGDAAAVEQAGKALEVSAKKSAATIREKYILTPHTTDFGLMFVPTEGLYGELVRRPGLADSLQRDHRVVLVGPTILGALLNSLQMGFRTLALQKRSSEVWTVLGAVKAEFGKFSEVLAKVQKKLTEASSTIEDASKRTRAMERTLKGVEQLPPPEVSGMLGLPAAKEGAEVREAAPRLGYVQGGGTRPNPATAQAELRLTAE